MIRILRCLALLCVILGCSSPPPPEPENATPVETDTSPAIDQDEHRSGSQSRDRGFGTLNDAREVKEATEKDGETSERALEEANQ